MLRSPLLEPAEGSVAMRRTLTLLLCVLCLSIALPVRAARPYEVVSPDGEVSGIHPELVAYLARVGVRPAAGPPMARPKGA